MQQDRRGKKTANCATSLRKQTTFCDATNDFPAKWRLRNDRRNSILMMRHYPHLGSASDWSCHQHGTFLHSFLKRHFVGKSVMASGNVVCFHRLRVTSVPIILLNILPQPELPLNMSFCKRPTNFDIYIVKITTEHASNIQFNYSILLFTRYKIFTLYIVR